MSQQLTRLLFASLVLILAVVVSFAQNNLTAKANNLQPAPSAAEETDRVRDGLIGAVRRVRTEVVKLMTVSGKVVEDSKRILLETSEYDLKGTKTQNQYFPVAGSTLTGRELYKYDDKGNISEMTLMTGDGTLVSRKVYKYEFDSVGNWVKMTTSVAVVENGRIGFELTEVTYRTIFYYLDANTARMLQASASSPSSTPNETRLATNEVKSSGSVNSSTQSRQDIKSATGLPPTTSLAKLKFEPVQSVAADMRTVNTGANQKVEVTDTDAPPLRPLLKPVSGGVLNGMALNLPAPIYPELARRMRVSGVVEVEVILDENGKVLSAKAVSGPSGLRDVSVQAAYRARFSPTKLSGQPVKVAGQINYRFTLPN